MRTKLKMRRKTLVSALMVLFIVSIIPVLADESEVDLTATVTSDRAEVDLTATVLGPPVADAGGPYSGLVGTSISFDGSGSTDDGEIVSYVWAFGDGGTGTGVSTIHTYTAAGDYTVTLTVTDDDDLTDSDTATATVTEVPPETGTLSVDTEPVKGEVFVDGESWGDAPVSQEVEVGAYTVTFGDVGGYTTPASQEAVVTVDTTTEIEGIYTKILEPPVADAGEPYYGRPRRAINFDGTGSSDPDGTIVKYEWVFGDGGTATVESPSHTYDKTGTYTVTLTVTDNDELTDSDTTTATIRTPTYPPVNKEPHAKAGPNQTAWVGDTVYFDGSKSKDTDGTIESYEWDFGDGVTDSGVAVEHEYSEPGQYTVTLTVRDDRWSYDSDTCKVKISEPPSPVSNKFAERVKGNKTGHVIDALEQANTTVTLDTTDDVTVTVLRYDSNPHPGDPIPAMALPTYVDVEVSNPDAVVWPIYVEISYTDEEIGELDENTFGIYYWSNETWQRCSDTGVNTMKNIVWAYMTAHEASGSPILIAGMHAIPTPPVPPFLDNLTVTPSELELGDNVTISLDIMNIDSQTYAVDMHIENVDDPPPTWPPMDVYLRIWVDLEDNESKTVSHTITMDAVGNFNVTVAGMTGSFKVGTWPPEPPLKPADFVVSDLTITPEEAELWEGIDEWTFKITVEVTNIGEQEGTHTVDLKVDGLDVDWRTVKLRGGESTPIIFDLTRDLGSYTVEVDGLTGSFVVKPYLKPAEFLVSDLVLTPSEIEVGGTVIISAKIANVGEMEGIYIVELKVDGQTVDTESVTLAGEASQYIDFTTSSEEEGEHTVEIDGLTDSFTVSKKPIRPIWMQPIYVVGILIIVASVGAVIYYAWKAKLFFPISSDST